MQAGYAGRCVCVCVMGGVGVGAGILRGTACGKGAAWGGPEWFAPAAGQPAVRPSYSQQRTHTGISTLPPKSASRPAHTHTPPPCTPTPRRAADKVSLVRDLDGYPWQLLELHGARAQERLCTVRWAPPGPALRQIMRLLRGGFLVPNFGLRRAHYTCFGAVQRDLLTAFAPLAPPAILSQRVLPRPARPPCSIRVRDLASSLRWYQDVLGMRVLQKYESTGTGGAVPRAAASLQCCLSLYSPPCLQCCVLQPPCPLLLSLPHKTDMRATITTTHARTRMRTRPGRTSRLLRALCLAGHLSALLGYTPELEGTLLELRQGREPLTEEGRGTAFGWFVVGTGDLSRTMVDLEVCACVCVGVGGRVWCCVLVGGQAGGWVGGGCGTESIGGWARGTSAARWWTWRGV